MRPRCSTATSSSSISNIAYSLLGLVIEEASGVPYKRLRSPSTIVDRVGLRNTGPDLDPARLDEYATGYTSLDYAETRIPIEHIDTAAMASATGFYSTAADVVRYAFVSLPRRRSPDLGRVETIDARIEWKVDGTDSSYGSGLAVATIGTRRVLGHGGGLSRAHHSHLLRPGRQAGRRGP
jgi:CubicO group peptidase (beta-lactamase class C family)